jgi:D-alanine-D-alanine ligase
MDASLNITLLAGGISAEREVSLQTGKQITAALRRSGHNVFESDISPGNLSALDHQPCDLVFPALHGTFGEDGQLQAILENRSIPFVGSDSAASRLSMDKIAVKKLLLARGIPTPPWQLVSQTDFTDSWMPDSVVGLPCAIKPNADGSSVACRICRTLPSAREHLLATLPRYGQMLVERCIEGPELTIGIIDSNPLPIIHIQPRTEFYDYQAKYIRNDTKYLFDIDLPEAVLREISNAGLRTYHCVGARHLARVDIMLDKTEPMVLEINTMPGFTTHSLVPKAAQRAGISFDALCDRLARLALRDAPLRTAQQ